MSQARGENFLRTEAPVGYDALAAFVAAVCLSRRNRPKANDTEWIAFGDETSPLQFEQ
jgi:hypothetical protein